MPRPRGSSTSDISCTPKTSISAPPFARADDASCLHRRVQGFPCPAAPPPRRPARRTRATPPPPPPFSRRTQPPRGPPPVATPPPPTPPPEPSVLAAPAPARPNPPEAAAISEAATKDAGAFPPLEDLVTRVSPAVVTIQTATARGTGFFVAADTILTNVHVVGSN